MAKLRLEIVTPSGRAFSGDVDLVVIPATEGEMGILPMHVPVLTALSPGELRISNNGREEPLVIGNGFAEVTQNQVTILTDMAHTDDEIDEKAAEAAVQRAREAMSDPLNTSDVQAELEASLKRSMAEIEFKRRRRRGSRSAA
jgi:F-type H+-transporting ATPase subunit epsilon